MAANVIISDENLFDNLKDLIKNPEKFIAANIEIGHIAPLEIKLKGEKFNHSLTTTVMKGLIDFQESINRSYCIAKYNSSDLRHLEDYERENLELVIVVNSGCTEIWADFKEIIKEIKEFCVDMTPNQKIAVICLFLASLLGYSIVNAVETVLVERSKNQTSIALEAEHTKQLLGTQDNMLKAFEAGAASQQKETDTNQEDSRPSEEDSLDSINSKENQTSEEEVAVSQEEKTSSYLKALTPASSEELLTISQIKEQYPQAAEVFNTMNNGVERLVKSTAQADFVRYNNVVEMSGDMAEKIVIKPRVAAEKIVMKDDFRVLKVDSTSTDVRKTLLRSPDGSEFSANFTDSSMGKEKLKKLNEAFWGYHPIDLSIEAKKSKGKIKDALITQVRDVKTNHSFKNDSDSLDA